MKVQILHHRDPDSDCAIEVFIDGARFTGKVEVEDIDPGRGYDADSIAERRSSATAKTWEPDATEFDYAVADALTDARFESFSL